MNSNTAIKLFLGMLLLVIIFHLCIILKFISYNIAWGGRLTNDSEMYAFESISIMINLFLSWILLMKGNFIKPTLSHRTITIILWVFFGLFALNTIGNIFAKSTFEKFFAIITGIFSILIWMILKKTT